MRIARRFLLPFELSFVVFLNEITLLPNLELENVQLHFTPSNMLGLAFFSELSCAKLRLKLIHSRSKRSLHASKWHFA